MHPPAAAAKSAVRETTFTFTVESDFSGARMFFLRSQDVFSFFTFTFTVESGFSEGGLFFLRGQQNSVFSKRGQGV